MISPKPIAHKGAIVDVVVLTVKPGRPLRLVFNVFLQEEWVG
jgi:hypothetical protein